MAGFSERLPQDERRDGYDRDQVAGLCARVEAGESLRQICKDPGVPSPATLHQWRMRHPEFAQMYAAARAAARRNQIQEDQEVRLRQKRARKHPWGRPDSYTEALGAEICRRIADGESLLAIGASRDMPAPQTIYKWLRKYADFRQDYARAREIQADVKFELAWEIARHAAPETERVARLQFDVIRWQVGRLSPKKYAETEPEGVEGFEMDVYVQLYGETRAEDTLELVAGPTFEAHKAKAAREAEGGG
ncbi:hypothetical protein [Phenylobacterium sp.]|uniref:terminase small subunit-like protein n=1 Tax=Phenylobacterium sp. TaxID=1871053 RepID=UPI0030F4A138